MEKLSDKEWLALRRYNTAPLSEIWRDAIDIVLVQRPVSYTAEQVCAAYNKPKPKPKTKTAEQVSDADKVISGLAQALTDGQVQCAELEAQLADAKRERGLAIAPDSQPYPTAEAYEKVCAALAEAQKAAEWKDELLKEFDTAAGTILEDAGCYHDDGLVCEMCQPFVDARKKYAEHINAPKSAEERVEIREESGDFPWVVYVDGHRISGHGIRNERGHDEGAEGMRKRFVAALKESEASE
jgi:hypothetical protein